MAVRVLLLMILTLMLGCGNEGATPEPGAVGTGDLRQEFAKAVANGDEGAVTQMLAAEPTLAAVPNPYNNQTPLHVAAATGDAGMVRLLLEKGADPNAMNDEGSRPVDMAVAEGASQEVIDLLGGSAQ